MPQKGRREGQIKPRGPDRFLVSIFIGSELVDGKRKKLYRSETVRGGIRGAEKRLRAMLREKDSGRTVRPSREAFSEYVARWLRDAVKPRVRASTFASYEEMLKGYVLPDLGPVRLDKLTVAGLQRLPNGNTVVCNWGGHGHVGKQPLMFEVTRDKKVVWKLEAYMQLRTPSHVQILDVPGDVTKGEVLR